jgi:PAS domain S-box-containing protein
MTIDVLLSFFAFFLYLQLGLQIVFNQPSTKVNRTFFYLCLSLAIWSFGFMFIHLSTTPVDVKFWERVSSFGWIFFPALLVSFFFVLKKSQNILFKSFSQLIFYLAAAIFFIQSLLGNLMTNNYIFIDDRWMFIPNVESGWYIAFMAYLVLSLLLSFYLLIHWSLSTRNRKEKKQSKIIMITLTLYFAGILMTNYILPIFRPVDFPGLIHLTSFFWAAGFGFAIVRYKFLVISPQTAANEIIANMKELLFFLDTEGKILRVNQFTQDVLGFEWRDIIDKPFESLLIGKETAQELLTEQNELEEIKPHDYYLRKKSGEVIPFNLSSASIKDEAGMPLGTIVVGYDVRYEKMLEEALIESEHKYRKLYSMVRLMCDNVPDMIWAKDLERRFVFANEATCKNLLFAADSEEPIGKTAEYFFNREKEGNRKQKEWFTFAEGEKNSDMSTLEERKASRYVQSGFIRGRFTYYDVNKAPFLDESGKLIGLVGCGRDVTQEKQIEVRRQQAETALAKEKELLSVTLRSIGDGVISTDTEGRIIQINKVAEQLTGWSRNDAIGERIDRVFRLLDSQTKEVLENPVDLILRLGKITSFEYSPILVTKSGKEMYISNSGAPIYNQYSEVIGVVIVFNDITSKQLMELELMKIQKLETVGILAGGIAHDFNNILTAIVGNISLVIRKLKDEHPNLKNRLFTAEKACFRARDLTRQLLTFAKGGELVKKTIKLNTIIEDNAIFTLKGSEVTYLLNISPQLKAVDVDESQISQVINNLVINAKQAMPEGGVLRITAANCMIDEQSGLPLAKGEFVRIEFADEGKGIPPEIIGQIFDPFFTTKKEGSGLGLAISFKIVTRHEGHIQVQSTPDKGSVFTLYLPVSRNIFIPEEELEDDQAFSGEGTVIIMDDESEIRATLSNMLEALGYEVISTKNGEETIRELRKAVSERKKVTFVILDLIIVGGMGGKETVINLREINPDIKVFVSSGYSSDKVVSNYTKYGFDSIIEKPYTINKLIKAIRELPNRENE